MAKFKKGDVVNILNRTLGGEVILEGKAIVTKPPRDQFAMATVQFDNGEVCERWIDPSAQGSLEACRKYMDFMNKALGKALGNA